MRLINQKFSEKNRFIVRLRVRYLNRGGSKEVDLAVSARNFHEAENQAKAIAKNWDNYRSSDILYIEDTVNQVIK
jgi:hypothetical protein